MSFSGNLRAEAARTIPSAKRDRDTAIAALIANICSFSETEEGVIRMRFSAGNLLAVRKCFTLIQKNVNIIPGLPAFWKNADKVSADIQDTDAGTSENSTKNRKAALPDPVLDASGQMSDLLKRLHFLNGDGTLRTQDGTLDSELISGNRSRSRAAPDAYCGFRELKACTTSAEASSSAFAKTDRSW